MYGYQRSPALQPPQLAQPQTSLAPDLQDLMGNSALLDYLRAGGGSAGDFTALEAERIGGSTDETIYGGALLDSGVDSHTRSGESADRQSQELLYGYLGCDDQSFKTEMGLFHMDAANGMEMDIATCHEQMGSWVDEDGDRTTGIECGAGVVNFDSGDLLGEEGGGYLDIGVDLLDFGSEATIGDEGLTLASGVTAAQVAVGAGSGENADSNLDWALEVNAGLAASENFGLHWDDADGDQVRELGFGLGLGPVGFDMKSEYLGQILNAFIGYQP